MPSASSPGISGRTGFDRALLGGKAVLLLAAAALVLAFPSMAPDAFILSVGVVIASYAALARRLELRRRLHRLHLARPRGVLRARRLRDRAADHRRWPQPLGRARRGRRGCRRARGADRRRLAAGPRGVVRDRVDRDGADPAAGLAELGRGHRRLVRAARAPALRRGRAPARAARAVLLPARGAGGRRPARVVGDRPVPLRHGPEGDPRGRGQGAVARGADVQVQARGLRDLGVLHRPRRRDVRAVVRLPRPDLPVLDPDRLLHGADVAARRDPQPLRPGRGGGDRGLRAGVLQEPVRRHPVPPRRPRAAARPGRAVHAGRRAARDRLAGQPVPADGDLDPRGVRG